MSMYQEILFLKSWFKGKFCVENVIPYYEPLINPSVQLERHYFWTNFSVNEKEFGSIDIARCTKEELSDFLGMEVPNVKRDRTVLRNCVNPKVGLHIFECAFKKQQMTLEDGVKE